MSSEKPKYYTDGKIEPFDYMQSQLTAAEWCGYLKGNIIKYASRCGKKVIIHGKEERNGSILTDEFLTTLDDAKKLRAYANKLVETLENFRG